MLLPIQLTNHLNYTQRNSGSRFFFLHSIEPSGNGCSRNFSEPTHVLSLANSMLRWNSWNSIEICNFRKVRINLSCLKRGLNVDKSMDRCDQFEILVLFMVRLGTADLLNMKIDGWHGPNSIMTPIHILEFCKAMLHFQNIADAWTECILRENF